MDPLNSIRTMSQYQMPFHTVENDEINSKREMLDKIAEFGHVESKEKRIAEKARAYEDIYKQDIKYS
jgi:hypothetical protein